MRKIFMLIYKQIEQFFIPIMHCISAALQLCALGQLARFSSSHLHILHTNQNPCRLALLHAIVLNHDRIPLEICVDRDFLAQTCSRLHRNRRNTAYVKASGNSQKNSSRCSPYIKLSSVRSSGTELSQSF